MKWQPSDCILLTLPDYLEPIRKRVCISSATLFCSRCPLVKLMGLNMFNKSIGAAVAAALAFSTGTAFAANPAATLTIAQSDGKSWVENVSGLLVVDAQNNFSMLQGTGTTGLFQNGQFVNTIDTVAHPDYWQWKVDATTGAGDWTWHTAETLSGTTPSVTDASNPWMAALSLNKVGGHGDPDLSYAISAVNNNTYTQTYTFAVGEAILPTVGSANAVHADIAGGLTTRDGNVTISPFGTSTAIQQFQLSADNGGTFINAGVDVGPQASATGTATYGIFNADATGPTGPTWNYMQLVSKFTLTGKDSASLVGYASITPVPEPETYAMLLAGLGMMGFMVRRRKI